jgi:hypothetical protein
VRKFLFDLAQFIFIALLAFSLFAWIEVKFYLPELERDKVMQMPADSARQEKADTTEI